MEPYNIVKNEFVKVITEMYPSEIHNGYIYVNSKEVVNVSNHWNHYILLTDFIDLAFINNPSIGVLFMNACNVFFIEKGTIECDSASGAARIFFGTILGGLYRKSPLLFLKYMLFLNHYSNDLPKEKYDLMIQIYAKNNSFGALRSIDKINFE